MPECGRLYYPIKSIGIKRNFAEAEVALAVIDLLEDIDLERLVREGARDAALAFRVMREPGDRADGGDPVHGQDRAVRLGRLRPSGAVVGEP